MGEVLFVGFALFAVLAPLRSGAAKCPLLPPISIAMCLGPPACGPRPLGLLEADAPLPAGGGLPPEPRPGAAALEPLILAAEPEELPLAVPLVAPETGAEPIRSEMLSSNCCASVSDCGEPFVTSAMLSRICAADELPPVVPALCAPLLEEPLEVLGGCGMPLVAGGCSVPLVPVCCWPPPPPLSVAPPDVLEFEVILMGGTELAIAAAAPTP